MRGEYWGLISDSSGENSDSSMEQPGHGNGVVRVTKDCVDLSGAVHLMPCSIGHYGPAPVSSFFTSKSFGETIDHVEVKEAAFRGRRLLGSTLELPANYNGYVLGKDQKATGSINQENVKIDEWQTQAQFRNMTYWNHDTMPSASDALPRCFDWLHLSTIIHGSISEEEVAAMMDEQNPDGRGLKRKSTS